MYGRAVLIFTHAWHWQSTSFWKDFYSTDVRTCNFRARKWGIGREGFPWQQPGIPPRNHVETWDHAKPGPEVREVSGNWRRGAPASGESLHHRAKPIDGPSQTALAWELTGHSRPWPLKHPLHISSGKHSLTREGLRWGRVGWSLFPLHSQIWPMKIAKRCCLGRSPHIFQFGFALLDSIGTGELGPAQIT